MTSSNRVAVQEETGEPFVRDQLQWLSYVLVGAYCYLIAAFGPVMPLLSGELHLNYTLTAAHFSAYALGVLTAGSTGDKFMSRLGRNTVLWGCSFLMLLGTVLIISTHHPLFTIIGAWVVGCTGSIMGQANTTIMADRFKEHRAVSITELNIAGSLFCCLAPLVVSTCVRTNIGWRMVFVLPMVLVIGLYMRFKNVASAFNKKEATTVKQQPLPSIYWAFWTVILLSVAGEWSIVFWATDFMMHVNNFRQADASLAVSVFLSAMLTGRVIGSRLSRWLHLRDILQTSAVLGLLGFLIFWLAKAPWLSLVGLFVAGLGQSNVYPLTFASAINSGAGQTNSATSRLSLASGTANLCTPILMGFIADRSGIFNAYAVVAVLWTLVIVLVFTANRLAAKKLESAKEAA
ncbi:MAG TPA: MFS transporter [Oculatellaceae cyanobacterium]